MGVQELVEFLNLLNRNGTYCLLAEAFNAFVSLPLPLSVGKCFLRALVEIKPRGRGAAITSISLRKREGLCEGICRSERERRWWAGRERNTDKYLERELFVYPGRTAAAAAAGAEGEGRAERGGRGCETDGGPGSVISGVAAVVNS